MSLKPVKAEETLAKTGTNYPAPFDKVVVGRQKRVLGNLFGLKNFGVNQTTLQPGAASALLHSHSKQDEFVYILDGTATLRHGEESFELSAGECFGFPAGGEAHQLLNTSEETMTYLEIGDRTAGDQVQYPEDDLKAELGADGKWIMTSKSDA